jgi:hypothetical protein
MSTHVEGGRELIAISFAVRREDAAPGTWRYNLADATGYEPGTTERGLLEQFAETISVQWLSWLVFELRYSISGI